MIYIGLMPASPDLLRAAVYTVLYRASRSVPLGIDDKQFRVVMLTARDDEQEVGS